MRPPRKRAAGYATLTAVPATTLDGAGRLTLLYNRAVTLHTKAKLIERLRDFDTTAAGSTHADERGGTIGNPRRRGALRRKTMFHRLATARYLRADADDHGFWVGFTGHASNVAQIHQESLRDRLYAHLTDGAQD